MSIDCKRFPYLPTWLAEYLTRETWTKTKFFHQHHLQLLKLIFICTLASASLSQFIFISCHLFCNTSTMFTFAITFRSSRLNTLKPQEKTHSLHFPPVIIWSVRHVPANLVEKKRDSESFSNESWWIKSWSTWSLFAFATSVWKMKKRSLFYFTFSLSLSSSFSLCYVYFSFETSNCTSELFASLSWWVDQVNCFCLSSCVSSSSSPSESVCLSANCFPRKLFTWAPTLQLVNDCWYDVSDAHFHRSISERIFRFFFYCSSKWR